MRPRLLSSNQTRTIGIEEHIKAVGFDRFCGSKPVLEEVPLPRESGGVQQRSGLCLESCDHPPHRQSAAECEHPVDMIRHDRACVGLRVRGFVRAANRVTQDRGNGNFRQAGGPKARATGDEIRRAGLRPSMGTERTGSARLHRGGLLIDKIPGRSKPAPLRENAEDLSRLLAPLL